MSDGESNRKQTGPSQENRSESSDRDRPIGTADAPSPGDQLSQAAQKRRSVEDEQEIELWTGSFSARAMIGKWILAAAWTVVAPCVILGVGIGSQIAWSVYIAVAVGLWGYFALQLGYRKLSVRYRLTSQRFIHESGLLTRKTDRIEVIDIDDVTFEQGIVERILGVGSIRIASTDRTHPELRMQGIDDVKRVATLIDDVRRKERRKRALHIESI